MRGTWGHRGPLPARSPWPGPRREEDWAPGRGAGPRGNVQSQAWLWDLAKSTRTALGPGSQDWVGVGAPGGLGTPKKNKRSSQGRESEHEVLEMEGAWLVWGQRSWTPGRGVQRILNPESQALKGPLKASNSSAGFKGQLKPEKGQGRVEPELYWAPLLPATSGCWCLSDRWQNHPVS